MPFSPREQADFPTGLPKHQALARLASSLQSRPRSRVGGWVSQYRTVLVVLRVFRSGYVFDGRWTDGPDGAHLAGAFRPTRISWLFFSVAIALIMLTDFAVPAPRLSAMYVWTLVILQRLAWAAAVIGTAAVGGRVLWNTIGKSDIQVIREHLKATFSRADV
jgi:hypothetical protein